NGGYGDNGKHGETKQRGTNGEEIVLNLLCSTSVAPLLRVYRSLRILRLEEESHPEAGDAGVHDLERAVVRGRPRVVLHAEDGGAVEQIEDVEVEREVRLAELEHLLHAEIERADRVETERIGRAGDEQVLVRHERVARVHAAAEERLAVALAQDEVRAHVDAPRELVETVGGQLVLRRQEVDAALAAAG